MLNANVTMLINSSASIVPDAAFLSNFLYFSFLNYAVLHRPNKKRLDKVKQIDEINIYAL